MIRTRTLLLALVLAFACAVGLHAQSTYATITGVVTDSTGAILPNAEIEAVETASNYKYTTKSNESGTYTLPQLREGNYRVKVSSVGLGDWVADNVVLQPRDMRRLDVTLTVATIATSVEVKGGATLIETESARISDTKEREYIRALPATIRRPWDFVNLTPQVRVSSFTLIRFAGSRARQGELAQDGMVMTRSDGSILSRTADYTEMFSEMSLDSAGNSAEFATLGQMNMTSRGGNNQWHGQAHEFYTAPGWYARNTFSPINTITKPVHKAGGGFGGPVIIPKIYDGHNKTFFMFTGQFTRQKGERVLLNPTVPLVPWRTGDFSGLLPGTVIKDPSNGQPFPNNIIPPQRISPVATALQKFYPDPNQFLDSKVLISPNKVSNEFRPQFAMPGYTARVDHRLSDKSSFYVRYFWTYWTLQNPGSDARLLGLPLVPIYLSYDDTRMLMASHTYAFGPTVVNEVRGQFGYTKSTYSYQTPLNGNDAVSSLGLKGLVDGRPNIGGYVNTSFSNIGITPLTFPYARDPGRLDHTYNFQDNVSWFKAGHTIKIGGQFSRYSTMSADQDSGLFGSITFSNRYTGQTWADFLLGIPSSASRSFVRPQNIIERENWGVFVTDSWKVTPKFTLTFGMRYDTIQPFASGNGLISAFDLGTSSIVVPDSSLSKVSPLMPTGFVKVVGASSAGYNGKTLIKTDRNNFAPRFAAAWRPFGSNTVFRAGYGIYYDVVPASLTTTGVPYVISEPTFTNPAVPTLFLPQVFPATSTGGPTSITLPSSVRKDIRIPYSMQYTATIEHAFGDTAVRLSYVGTNTRQGVWGYNANQPVPDTRLYINKPRPFPNYPGITFVTNGAGHQYNGGSIGIGRRTPWKGLQFDLMFTLARDIGNLDHGEQPEDAFNRQRERAVVSDMPQKRLVAIWFYDFPFGKGKKFAGGANGILDLLVSRWRITSKNSFESGLYVTPSWTGPDPTGTAYTTSSTPPSVTIRPNQIRDPKLANPDQSHWFDAGAFTAPTPGYFGSSAKNVIVGPGMVACGLSIQKFITLKERATLRLELMTNNFLNHPNIGNPSANISNASSVTRITSQGLDGIKQDDTGPRRFLLQGRIEF